MFYKDFIFTNTNDREVIYAIGWFFIRFSNTFRGSNKGEKMFEPAVTNVFANVNLTLFVYFSSSSKCKYFFLLFEVNFTIFTPILGEQLLLSKRVFKRVFNEDISTL